MGHYYYGIIIHTCAVTSNNISLCALLLSEALLHLMYALVRIMSVQFVAKIANIKSHRITVNAFTLIDCVVMIKNKRVARG